MTRSFLGLVALGGALGLGLAARNGGGTTSPPINTGTKIPSYVQIELLARPAVKEVFENFTDHATTNAVEPYAGSPSDPLQAEIASTENALRPPNAALGTNYGNALASILYPNEYAVDLSNVTDKASYLGVETGGATGGKFGGRDLADDVVGISLGALFGGTLPALGVQPEDHEENGCIATENLAQNASQAKSTTFPYLASPH